MQFYYLDPVSYAYISWAVLWDNCGAVLYSELGFITGTGTVSIKLLFTLRTIKKRKKKKKGGGGGGERNIDYKK